MKPGEVQRVRPVMAWALVVCLGVAMAPWLSGGQQPLAMFMSAGALLVGVALVWLQPEVRWLKRGPLVWSYFALMGWAGLSLLWSVNRYSTLLWLVVMGFAGLAFRLSYVVAGQERGRQRLVWVYLASVAAILAYGFWLYLTVSYGRFVSSFYWPNAVAIYLVPATLLAVHQLRRRDKWVWLWWGFLVLAGTAFALADSRASTFVLLIALALYLAVARVERRRWLLISAALGGVLFLSNLFVHVHQVLMTPQQKATPVVQAAAPGTRYKELVYGSSQSGNDRLWYLKAAAEMWWDRPLTGVGAGAYGDAHTQYQGRVVSAGVSAHNFYVQVLAELGIVGFMLLMWFILALLTGVARGLLSGQSEQVVLALGLGALLVHIGMDMDGRYPALVLLAAVLAGLIYGQGRPVWRKLSVVPIVASVVVLIFVIGIYKNATWADEAKSLQDEGEYTKAAKAFHEAQSGLFYDPDNVSGEAMNLYFATGFMNKRILDERLDQVLGLARQAEKMDPMDAKHYQVEAWALYSRKDLVGAAAALKTALKLDPYNYPPYAADLAAVRLNQQRPDDALRVAKAMLGQYTPEVIENRSIDTTLKPNLARLWAVVSRAEKAKGNEEAARAAAGSGFALDGSNKQLQELVK